MALTKDQVVVDSKAVLTVINSQLPFLKAVIPALASNAGLVGMAVSAAQALVAIIQAIPTGGTISAEEQAVLKKEVDDIVSGKAFEGDEWKPSGYVHPEPAPVPTTKEVVAQIKSGS